MTLKQRTRTVKKNLTVLLRVTCFCHRASDIQQLNLMSISLPMKE